MYKFVSRQITALVGVFLLSFTLWSSVHFTGVAHAATPTLNFQARLESNTGGIASDGNYNVEFKLYEGGTEISGGTNVWTETRKFDGGPDNRVRVANGYLTVNLGSVTNFPGTINWDDDLYLTMNIGGTATGTPTWDGEMNPRLKLTSVPYAFQAQSATQLEVKQGVNTGNLSFDTLTTDRNILLPDADGTLCLQQSATNTTNCNLSGSFIQNQYSTAQTGNFNLQAADNATDGTVAAVLRGADGGQTVDLLQFQASNGTVLTAFTATGDLQVASSVDTYTATDLNLGVANATAVNIADTGVATTVQGSLTVDEAFGSTGLATLSGGLTVTSGGNVAIQRNTTDYTATGQQNNVDFGTGALFRITSAAGLEITGIDGGTDGRMITLFNASSDPIIIANNDSVNSAADNVITTGTGGDISITAGSSLQLIYDSASSLWRIVSSVNDPSGSIQNQNSADQDADFRIDGTGQANTSFLTPVLDTPSAGSLSLGTSTATSVDIAKSGVTTTVQGALTVDELLTGSAGATISGGAISLTGNAASSFTTSSGALTLTSATAATWSTTAGDLTLQAGSGEVSLGTSTKLKANGALDIITGGANVLGLDTGGGAAINIGGTNANAVNIGRNGVQTEIKGDTKVTLNPTTGTGLVCQNTSTGVLSACDSSYQAPNATNFIQNQNTSTQTAADFWIDGTGHVDTLQADTTVQTPDLDTATAAALGIGVNNATDILIGHNAGTLGIDATNFDLSTAGVVTLAGGQAIDLSSNGATTLTVDTGGAAALNLGTTNANAVNISKSGVVTTIQGTLTVDEAATFDGIAQFNDNVTVATGKTLRLTGGTTNSVAPTAEGQLYFDTDTNQLLVAFQNPDTGSYQWKASSQEAILVAASNSSAADKQAADYVADGTADQTEINYALTKGAGKRVVLLPGTYVASGTILVPDNTVLAGTNRNSTIVQLSVGSSTDNLIENSTGFGHTNITIQDLTLDGSLGTGGTQQGIYLHDGDISNRSSITNVKFTSWAHGNSLALSGAYIDTISGSILGDVSVATTQIKNFTNNQFNDVNLTSSSVVVNFANNVFNDISIDATSIDAFTGNDLSDMTLSGSGNITTLTGNSITGMLTMSGSASIVDVTGNNIGTGVTMTGSTTIGLLSSNAMGRISVTNSTVLTIVGNNIIYAGADNGIKLVNADNTKITENRLIRLSGSAAAISIDAASDGTFLADNVIGGASISDSGTNTVYSGQHDGSTYKIQPADDFTITGTAASTISTTAGDLTLQGGSGDVSLGTSTKLKANGALNITSGGANALGLDTGGGAAINIGGTNATSIVLGRSGGGTIRVGQNGGTVQIDGTNFDVSTLGVVTLAGGQTNDIITSGATTLKVDTGGAAAISIGTTNATNITIGHNGGTFAVDGTNFDVSTAGVITLPGGQTNDIVTAGATTLKLDTGGSAALSLGSANASSINIGNSSATTVTIQAAAGSGNGVAVQSSSATSFRVQSSGGASTLLTADATSNRRVTVGTVGSLYGTSTANGDLVVVGNTELQGRLYIGNSANDAIYTSSAGGPLRFKGNARNDNTVTLTPEFPGATLNGTGIGTMTSDFCSNFTSGLTVNTTCGSNQVHNYYEWFNGTQPTNQTYSVYTRWQVPSNADSTSLSFTGSGWATTNGTDTVTATFYDASGVACNTAVSLATGTGAWTTSSSTNLSGCTLTPGSNLTVKLTLTAAQNHYARVGELTINYKSLF